MFSNGEARGKSGFWARISAERVWVPAFFLVLVSIGILVYRDFGLHWDSNAQMQIGEFNYNYIFKQNPALLTFKNRYYGPAFDLILFMLTRGLPSREMYFARSLVLYLYFCVGVLFFYLLARKFTGSWKLGLLASLFLVTSPRIFADSFYNAKDIPFLVTFIISIYTLALYLERKTLRMAVLHAVVSAFLIAIRAPGFFLPGLTVGIVFLDMLYRGKSGFQPKLLIHLFVYGILTAGFIILFWPILWHDPVHELISAVAQAGDFPWRGGVVLYRGSMIEGSELPWHYIPVWILISTPLVYLISAAVGFIKAAFDFVKQPGHRLSPEKRPFIILTAWLILPWLVIVATGATLYDAWRHMFFLYPSIVIFAVLGVRAALSLRISRVNLRLIQGFVVGIVFVGVLQPTIFMIRNHPFETVYFNRLAGRDMQEIKRKFELDYWGLSYRKGLEFVLAADPSAKIPVYVEQHPGLVNQNILPPVDRKRIQYVDSPEKARYYLTNYRYHPEPYDYPDEVFNIQVGDARIFSVFRLNP